MKRKKREAGAFLFEHFCADDVGGHEVRRELDTLRVEAQCRAKRLDERGFCEARNADEQSVPPERILTSTSSITVSCPKITRDIASRARATLSRMSSARTRMLWSA